MEKHRLFKKKFFFIVKFFILSIIPKNEEDCSTYSSKVKEKYLRFSRQREFSHFSPAHFAEKRNSSNFL